MTHRRLAGILALLTSLLSVPQARAAGVAVTWDVAADEAAVDTEGRGMESVGIEGVGTEGSTSENALTLAWDPPTDNQTVGYIVWYGTSSGAYTQQVNVGFVTSWEITGLTAGTTYYLAVQAYNDSAMLSPMSAEVSGTTAGATEGGGTEGGGTEGGGTEGGGTGTGGPGNGNGSGNGQGGTNGGGSGKTKKPRPTKGGVDEAFVDGYVDAVRIDAPRSLTATVIDGRAVRLEWEEAPDAAGTTHYLVEAGTAPGRSDLGTVTTTALSLTTPALPNATYFARVRGVTAAGPGAPSNEVTFHIGSAVTCTDVPARPTLVATARGNVVTVSWTPGEGDAPNGYVLDAGSAPGLHDIATMQFGAESGGFTTPAPNGTYWLRLIAINACGASVVPAEAIITVGGPAPSAPGDALDLRYETLGRSVTLAWSAAANGGEATEYLIEVSDAQGNPIGTLETHSAATAFALHDVPPGHYLVRVRAANAGGVGAPSNSVAITVSP